MPIEPKTAVYILEPILDDPRFEGFGSAVPGSFPDALPKRITKRLRRIKRLAPTWIPFEVLGRVQKYNDYPCVGMRHPAFSERAVEALRDLLVPNGELLPLSTTVGSYFHFNPTTIADVLDEKASSIDWLRKPRIASSIDRYEFRQRKVEGLSFFCLPIILDLFVTSVVVNRAKQHGLRGMNFIKVWPLPEGVIWWHLAKIQKRRQLSKGLPKGQTIKGNTVVIRLKLGKSKATEREKKAISDVMDELDALLVTSELEQPLVGSLEGSDYGVEGECRLYLSCPDANVLAEKLRPCLAKLRWKPGLIVLKRYGDMWDKAAREKIADL